MAIFTALCFEDTIEADNALNTGFKVSMAEIRSNFLTMWGLMQIKCLKRRADDANYIGARACHSRARYEIDIVDGAVYDGPKYVRCVKNFVLSNSRPYLADIIALPYCTRNVTSAGSQQTVYRVS